MKRSGITLLVILFFTKISLSQSPELSVYAENGKLYLAHTVVAKENWYSVGRIYNVSPKDLAPFNGLTIENPLNIGQELKIPLTSINFTQDGQKRADETFVPIFHTVQPNEPLTKISADHNKVPLENLEKWNKIKKDGAKEGMQVIVGFLKVKSSLSYLADKGILNYEAAAATKSNNVEKPVIVPEVNKSLPVAKQSKTPETKSNSMNETKPVFTRVSNTAHFNGSYFANDYNDGNNKINGIAGVFKSTSGWNDGKYYVLVNNIPVGTIIKIISTTTQKTAYAKVLGQLPDMKESEGLTIRISDAAASELGEAEGKFNIQLRY